MHPEETHFHGLRAIRLHLADGSQAVVTLAGAHLVSWTTADGVERLYMSPHSRMEAGHAIRGGVPVIFPQFSTRGPLMRHGFARVSTWEVLPSAADASSVTLGLRGNGAAWDWPSDFACEMAFQLAPDTVSMQLTVHNTGNRSFTFSAALHTYLQISALDSVRLSGLQHVRYEDSRAGGALCTDSAPHVAPTEALDRIYLHSPPKLQVQSAHGALELHSQGFCDTVVWNPGQAGNAQISDLPPDAYREFLCVEAAVIGQPVTLESACSWSGTQTLRHLPDMTQSYTPQLKS
ncbi:MAG: D-hexose-6-phosphate mutarotase [Rhodoferax sp.]|nr:D-hexose-6-phosphate mutarotase [Rhodoferax sp.]